VEESDKSKRGRKIYSWQDDPVGGWGGFSRGTRERQVGGGREEKRAACRKGTPFREEGVLGGGRPRSSWELDKRRVAATGGRANHRDWLGGIQGRRRVGLKQEGKEGGRDPRGGKMKLSPG